MMRHLYFVLAVFVGVALGCSTLNAQDLTLPDDITVECGGSLEPDFTGMATATDNCASGGVSVTFDDNLDGLTGCGGTGQMVRTWMATSDCGTATAEQIITLVDTTPPNLVVPGDIEVECGGSVNPAVTGVATATDQCSGTVSATYTDSGAPVCDGTVVRQWVATDACGNQSTATQNLSIKAANACVDFAAIPICDNASGTFTLTVNINFGVPPFQVSGSVNIADLEDTQFTAGPFDNNSTYSLTITDATGCSVTKTTIVECEILPVELLSFTGEVKTQGNLLEWVTATEKNADYFILESSKDGHSFGAIAKLDAAGNSSEVQRYQYLHKDAGLGTTYYRLLNVDLDGTVNPASAIIPLERKGELGFGRIAPVPARDQLEVEINMSQAAEFTLTVFDVTGRQIRQIPDYGSTVLNLDVSGYPSGVYTLVLQSQNQRQVHKFVVSK